jgi:hypothetical protein
VAEQRQDPRPPGSGNVLLPEVIEEFGRHLDILGEQLAASLAEADQNCVSVGRSFHELSEAKTSLESLPCAEPARSVLQATCVQIGSSLHDAVVALQYHDRLAQRLELVRSALNRLQTLLKARAPRSDVEWLQSLRDLEQINRVEQRRLGPPIGQVGPEAEAVGQSTVELF